MLRNVVRTLIRDALKSPLLNIINIGGLAVGFAAFLAIIAYVNFDLSYDAFIPDYERIHRVEISYSNDNGTDIHASAGPVSAKPVFMAEFPDAMEAMTRFYVRTDREIRAGENVFIDDIMITDAEFFDVFDLPFVTGNRETAFKSSSSIVLTSSMATKYFGDHNPIGEVLDSFIVTGVIEDLPQNSHLSLGLIAHADFSTLSWWEVYSERWDINFMYTYLKMNETQNPKLLRDSFEYLISKYLGPMVDERGIDPNDFGRLRLVGLPDIHFEPTSLGAIKPHNTRAANYTFIAVAFLILSVAVLNFVNLSTARATRRSKEIALRKLVGARRRHLIIQFMTEAVVTTTVAALAGLTLLELAAPLLEAEFGIQLQQTLMAEPGNLIALICLVLIVGILAGAYPAFLLSAFRPANHLNGGRSEVSSTIRTRSILVVVQFAASIALIICTTVIYQQTKFARTIDLGFDRSGVVVLNRLTRDNVGASLDAFIAELKRHPETIAAAPTDNVPGDDSEGNVGVRLPNEDSTAQRTLSWQDVGYDYYSALSIEPLAGRVFSREYPGDVLTVRDEERANESGGAILNVSAAELLGFSKLEDAIGKSLIIGDSTDLKIVGVVPDIRYRSVRQPVRPGIHMLELDRLDSLLVKYSSDNAAAYLNDLNSLWQQLVPGAVMQMEHLDQKLDALYGSEDQWARMFLAASLLAIAISALGLFGLTTFAVERRMLEVGVRKVLGARIYQIIQLFSWQFTKPLLTANLIAWPLAWYFMSEWLGNFAFRIELGLWPFALAAVLVFVVAWTTVAMCAYRIARTRPAQTLRYQ